MKTTSTVQTHSAEYADVKQSQPSVSSDWFGIVAISLFVTGLSLTRFGLMIWDYLNGDIGRKIRFRAPFKPLYLLPLLCLGAVHFYPALSLLLIKWSLSSLIVIAVLTWAARKHPVVKFLLNFPEL